MSLIEAYSNVILAMEGAMASTARGNHFDLIRLVLALLVILSHSFEIADNSRRREILFSVFGTMSFGDLAVDCFFVLSGYLIMQSWDRQPNASQFLRNRVLRIYPGFIVATLICAFIVGPLAASSETYFSLLNIWELLGGMVLLQKPVVPQVFAGLGHPGINNSMWSISYEFLCYLSILILGTAGTLKSRRPWLALTGLAFACQVVATFANIQWPVLRTFLFFLSGGSLYLYRDHIKFTTANLLVACASLFILMFYWRTAAIAVASAGAYLLLYLGNGKSVLLSHFNRIPDISYGTYLYGWPIQKLLLWYFPFLSPWALFALCGPLALLSGTISWYLIEKPALRFKNRSAMHSARLSDPVKT